MADYRRQYDESSREPRSWFSEDDPRRRRGNEERDDRYPYSGERNSRYEASRSSGYEYRGDDRGSRWEGAQDDRYGYGGSTGMYRTDDRPYHDHYRDQYRDERYDRDDRYDRDAAANDYYRAARDQRDDYMRWSAQNMGVWGDQSHMAHREQMPHWLQRERGGYWRQSEHRGQYAGRGPRDYRRSDDRIREEICDCMTDDSMLDASDVIVEVRQGEVTLTGSVMSRDQKRRAEDVAERISGVRDVTNQLRVQRESDGYSASSQPVTEASGKGTPGKSTSSTTA
jgi:osmotically-inducible protein OsmY